MRTGAITSILQNYSELCEALEMMTESETGPGGSKAENVFGLKASLKVFAISEEVSRGLQVTAHCYRSESRRWVCPLQQVWVQVWVP